MAIQAKLRLILDCRGNTLGDIASSTPSTLQDITEEHIGRLLGSGFPEPTYHSDPEFSPSLPDGGNGYPEYDDVVAAAAAGIQHFNSLSLGITFHPPVQGQEPTCVRWEFIDGEWMAIYNYDVDTDTADPGREPLPGAKPRIVLVHPIPIQSSSPA